MRNKALHFARLLGSNVWPLADQALIAAVSFATMLMLARQLSVHDFGAFTLVFSLFYFAGSMQSGLITQPHNVLGAARHGYEYVVYTSSTAFAQILLATGSALLMLCGWCVSLWLTSGVAPLLLAAAPAAFAWQIHEFARRVLYTERRTRDALIIDVIGYGAHAAIVAWLWRTGGLTGTSMLYALAACSAVASVVGLAMIRHSLTGCWRWSDVRENWHFGKWVAGGTIVGEWLSAQMLVYVASVALGLAAAGVLRAVHTLFGPARILAQVFNVTLPTRLAVAIDKQGPRAFNVMLRNAVLGALVLLGGYCVLTIVLARPLLQFAFGQTYVEYAGVLQLYAVSAFLTYLCMIGTAALRAMRRTRAIFVSEIIYLLVIPAGTLLIPFWDLSGLVVALIAGDVAALAYIGWACAGDAPNAAASDDATVPSLPQQLPQGAIS